MRALRPYRVELARDYHLSLADLDGWEMDDLIDLVFDVHAKCHDPESGYRVKQR